MRDKQYLYPQNTLYIIFIGYKEENNFLMQWLANISKIVPMLNFIHVK